MANDKTTNLKTTLNGLHSLNRIQGVPGSYQDALHQDSQMAHYFRSVLERIKDGAVDPRTAAAKALIFTIGKGEPILLPNGSAVHQNAD